MKNYLRLLRFLKGHKGLFSMAVLTMIGASLFEGAQWSLMVPLMDRIFNNRKIVVPNQLPAGVTHIIDYLNSVDPKTLLWALPLFVSVVMILKQGFTYGCQFLMNDVSQRVMRDVRYELYAKIQHLSLDYFSAKRTGELISRITNDVQVIENAISYGITDLFRQSILIVMYIVIAFSIHPKAALLIFCVLPFMGLPISKIGSAMRKLSRRGQERMADINSILIETISGVRVVKAFCTEQYEIDRFKEKNQDFYKLKMKSVKRLILINPITEIFALLCGVVIIIWIGKQIMDEKLSVGIFGFFFSSIMSIISPVKKLGNVHAMTQQALAANERIYEILDRKPTVQEKLKALDIPVVKHKITLEDVTFAYDAESGDVLKNINLEIKVGELVAIVGPTGTGKTTLVNLIPRFYDPRLGKVKFDGVDVREATFRSVRLQIAHVAQETFLFNDTVRSNIAYGIAATQEEIESAAKKAYAHGFITQMPQGYETLIGDRGFRLSGGEKQRIAIARAILRNPPILVLDEATSQLDSESEKYIQEALDKFMQGRTVIAIAHRLSTIQRADKIVVLEKGQIVGMGTHEQLVTTCDLYRRLYETQFQA